MKYNLAAALSLIEEFIWDEYNEAADFSDLSRVPLAYTSIFSDLFYEVQVYADLVNFRLVTEYHGDEDDRVDVNQYDSLAALIETELKCLEFDSLVCGLNEFE